MASQPKFDPDETYAAFTDLVNMTPSEITAWLKTKESLSVGWTRRGETESIGHQSGRRIVRILRQDRLELEDDDYAHMRKVVGYIKRHRAQRPTGDVSRTRWRFSLMNWGHDPLKE